MFLRSLVIGDPAEALELVPPLETDGAASATPETLGASVQAYHEGHECIRMDPEARNVRHTYVVPSEDKHFWKIQQMLIDPAEQNDWVVEFQVDLEKSRESGEPVMHFLRLGELGGCATG